MADNSLPCFIIGVGVGAALGLLFAPRAGEETREDLLRRADESRDYVRRRSEELRGRAAEAVERSRGAIGAQRGNLQSALDAGRKAYREAAGETREEETAAEGAETMLTELTAN